MPATPWVPLSVAQTPWIDSLLTSATSGTEDAFVMFGLLIPEEDFVQFIDPTTSWTELSIGATASTELTVAATPWTELTG